MPRFHYIAIAGQGARTKGTITAESPYSARKQLRVRGIHPTSIDEIKSSDTKTAIFSIFKKSSKTQLIDFTKQMSTLLNSGIKLTESLTVLTMQTTDPKFKNALNDNSREVKRRQERVKSQSWEARTKQLSDLLNTL